MLPAPIESSLLQEIRIHGIVDMYQVVEVGNLYDNGAAMRRALQ
jgi:hypothetical protein